MNIDRAEFLSWMERMMTRFDILGEQVAASTKPKLGVDGEELIDNQDVMQILKISSRSLQRYRTTGRLAHYTISGKLYYKLSDIHQFIRENFSKSTKEKQDKG